MHFLLQTSSAVYEFLLIITAAAVTFHFTKICKSVENHVNSLNRINIVEVMLDANFISCCVRPALFLTKRKINLFLRELRPSACFSSESFLFFSLALFLYVICNWNCVVYSFLAIAYSTDWVCLVYQKILKTIISK